MREPEKPIAYPCPTEAGAKPDRSESAEDKKREQRMHHEHRVGQPDHDALTPYLAHLPPAFLRRCRWPPHLFGSRRILAASLRGIGCRLKLDRYLSLRIEYRE